MKIAYIAPQAIPSQAANSVHMMKMAQAMAENGHDITLFAARGSNDSSEDIFNYYGVKQNFKLQLQPRRPGKMGLIAYGFRNAADARAMKAELVFSRCLMSGWACAIANLPVLYEMHDSPDTLNKIASSIFRRLIQHKNFRGIVVISQALKNHMSEIHKIPAEKIIVAHDGADPLPPAQGAPFEKTPGSFHAGYTGHLYSGRGIEIIAGMAKNIPDATFHIVGGTPDDLAHWKNELKSLKNFIFYGHAPPSRVPDFLQNFDVLLAPYQKKVAVAGNTGDTSAWMSPLKIFEYMATGKPMICSDMPVLREILKNDENALLRPPESITDWTKALKFLRDNPKDAARIGKTAQDDFLSHHTWKKRAEAIFNALSER
ncbi:MAG: glycosyltransferase [Alphaproteobacteria bacterium PRO2]|nr:glycosyltransferase [Alphaproteobacteria bacterium PRO2]